MTKLCTVSRLMRGAALAAGLGAAVSGQITQNRPELCGATSGAAPIPDNVTASASGDSTLTIGKGAGATEIPLSPGSYVDQVCPLSRNRLLVFGENYPGAFTTAIVDLEGRKLVDSFYGWGAPVISPDQRWLIMTAPYPAQSDTPYSEEYLLYDLTKDRAGNTMPGVTVYTDEMRGRAVYPAVDGGTPFEHRNLPADQHHSSSSTWFYWAGDSTAVLFADSVQKTLSLVMVRTDSDPPRAYVHTVTPSEACQQGPDGNTEGLMLSAAEVSPEQPGGRMVLARFRLLQGADGACRPQQVVLNESDFKPAPVESHPPIIRNKPVIVLTAPPGQR